MSNLLEPTDDGLPMRPAGKWVVEKLDYLARYIDIVETAMHRRFAERNYIDLMAGPGKNLIRGSGDVALGSPLLAIATKHPFTRYYFVDNSDENVNTLSRRCDSWVHARRVHIETGDCNVLVDKVVAQIDAASPGALNLAFLDPEGFELRWTTLAKLASLRRMDLIINYPEGGLKRMMKRLINRADLPTIDQYFGDDRWRSIYSAYERGSIARSSLVRQLIDLYRDNLKSLGYTDVQRGDELFQAEPAMRNAKRTILYRLLFASKNPLGNEFWRKITHRDIYGQTPLL